MTAEVEGAVRTPRHTVVFGVLTTSVAIQAVVAVTGAFWSGMSGRDVVDSYLATNVAIAVSFGACGALVAWHRPRHRVGWLLMAVGLAQGTTAAVSPLLVTGAARGWSEGVMVALATAYAYGWPWSIGLLLPVTLLLFPDGRLPGRRWRWVLACMVGVGIAFVVMMGTEPGNVTLGDGTVVAHPLTLRAHGRLAGVWAAVGLAQLGAMLAALAALTVRYLRGSETQRRQLMWLLLGVAGSMVVPVATTVLGAGPVLLILAICLIPTAIAIAILRHNLLDIRLVISRALLWLLLSLGVIGAYIGLVAAASLFLASRTSNVLAALAVALAFNPVRLMAQRLLDRLLYGHGRDPVGAVARVEDQLGRSPDLDALLDAIRDTLRLPYAALDIRTTDLGAQARSAVGLGPATSGSTHGATAASGVPPPVVHAHPLIYADAQIGELVIGLRPGEQRLRPQDRRVLELLATPLAVAVHAMALSQALQQSREALIAAREDERRRLRRDLHDGLGPALTGVTLKADAARNLLAEQPVRADALLAQMQTDIREAITDIRRIIHELRPPALDDLGLIGALRQHIDQLGNGHRPGVDVQLEGPATLPALPPAIEVAAYRVAMEALTNTVRHAGARHAVVRLAVDADLQVEVIDDGPVREGVWQPGVGLTAMGERITELGGVLQAGPGPDGGQVLARFPLERT